MKKYLLSISLLINIIGLSCLIFVFFYFGGPLFWTNKIENVLDGPEKASITRIREDNLLIVGSNPVDIVFAGDSHTNYFEWAEYFNGYSVANRGIGSDTSEGLLNRIGEINKLNPKKVFIMIGINDLQQNVNSSEIVNNLNQIIQDVRNQNSETEIFIESILPVSVNLYEQNFYKDGNDLNERVLETNAKLEGLQGVTFINLIDVFGDNLNEKYSIDGIHLNQAGYQMYLNYLDDYVAGKI